jgi:8-oxo-dGTP diphosphatase
MKERKDKSRVPILAAGGIVLRNDRRPQFAIVQLRKWGAWGLPKGKLVAGEDAIAAARREVLEETGHRVTVHEFLGTLAYETSGRPKVVQFWRMHVIGGPASDLTRDVTAVDWLALEDAIDRLTHLRERLFLEQVGPIALKFAERTARRAALRGQAADENLVRSTFSGARIQTIGKVVPLAPVAEGDPPPAGEDREEGAETIEPEPIQQDFLPPQAGESSAGAAADILAPAQPSWRAGQGPGTESGVGRGLIGKTRAWFRHASMSRRQPLD